MFDGDFVLSYYKSNSYYVRCGAPARKQERATTCGKLELRQAYEGSTILGKKEKEQRMKTVTLSRKCLETYSWMKFGYCFVNNLASGESVDHLREKQEEGENYIRTKTEFLIARAKSISKFYQIQGEKDRSHIESLIKSISNGKSIKPVNFIVDSVMIAELRNALLLGVHE